MSNNYDYSITEKIVKYGIPVMTATLALGAVDSIYDMILPESLAMLGACATMFLPIKQFGKKPLITYPYDFSKTIGDSIAETLKNKRKSRSLVDKI